MCNLYDYMRFYVIVSDLIKKLMHFDSDTHRCKILFMTKKKIIRYIILYGLVYNSDL